MTFLALNGQVVPCLQGQNDEDAEEVGADRARMFDASMRMTRRGLMRKWSITTNLLDPSSSDYATIRSLINQGGNITATGDLVESSSGVLVMPVPGKNTPVATGLGLRRRMTFVLEEQPTPFVADRSAAVYAFFQRGVGYLKGDWTGAGGSDYSACTPSADGELVSVWQDQSGHGYDLLGGINPNTLVHYHGWDATRDGDELRMGTGIATGGGAPGGGGVLDGRTYYGRKSSAWWTALAKCEIMIGVRASNGAPSSDGRNALWSMAGTGNSLFPNTSGHIIEVAFSTTLTDLGDVSPVADLGGLNVYDLSIGLHADTPNFVAFLNNSQLAAASVVSGGYPVFANPTFGIGGATGFFDGWIRDIVVFNAPLTPSQRLSWYRYLIGTDAAPPI